MVPWVGLQLVIVVFPDHTYLPLEPDSKVCQYIYLSNLVAMATFIKNWLFFFAYPLIIASFVCERRHAGTGFII